MSLCWSHLARSDPLSEKIFEELDYRETPLGALILRRRRIRSLDDLDVFEVKLGDAFLMSSLFTTVGDLLKWEENFEHPVVGDARLLRDMEASAILTNGDTTGYGAGIFDGTGTRRPFLFCNRSRPEGSRMRGVRRSCAYG